MAEIMVEHHLAYGSQPSGSNYIGYLDDGQSPDSCTVLIVAMYYTLLDCVGRFSQGQDPRMVVNAGPTK